MNHHRENLRHVNMTQVIHETGSALISQPIGEISVKAVTPSLSPLIFIIDDEPTVGGVVETILQMDGFQTVFFQKSEEAIKAFESANPRPQLIVTDFVMGAVNGMEVIDHCVRLDSSVKTVLYSGNVGAEIMRDYRIQPDRFISKPFQPKQLSMVVQELLSQ